MADYDEDEEKIRPTSTLEPSNYIYFDTISKPSFPTDDKGGLETWHATMGISISLWS
jgi:hypothetical protein